MVQWWLGGFHGRGVVDVLLAFVSVGGRGAAHGERDDGVCLTWYRWIVFYFRYQIYRHVYRLETLVVVRSLGVLAR